MQLQLRFFLLLAPAADRVASSLLDIPGLISHHLLHTNHNFSKNHPPPASSTPICQVPSKMTQEQEEQIFELTRRKLGAELDTAEKNARFRRVAAEEESKLR